MQGADSARQPRASGASRCGASKRKSQDAAWMGGDISQNVHVCRTMQHRQACRKVAKLATSEPLRRRDCHQVCSVPSDWFKAAGSSEKAEKRRAESSGANAADRPRRFSGDQMAKNTREAEIRKCIKLTGSPWTHADWYTPMRIQPESLPVVQNKEKGPRPERRHPHSTRWPLASLFDLKVAAPSTRSVSKFSPGVRVSGGQTASSPSDGRQ